MGIKEKILDEKNELHKFVILLANANNEPIRGRLKLQKMMYLLSHKIEEVKEQSSYDADNYGPYSEIIDDEEQYLEHVGVLTSDNSGEIALTEIGKEIARELSKKADKGILETLDNYKEFLNDLTSKELLTYIYSAYPDMAGESTEYENLKPHMEKHVMSLIKKQKISAERGSELLNKPLYQIIQKMKDE